MKPSVVYNGELSLQKGITAVHSLHCTLWREREREEGGAYRKEGNGEREKERSVNGR